MQLKFSDISKYRSKLMGIATIGILICHAVGNHVALGPLSSLFVLGQFGNALFFMLSGFGLFYSLSKIQFTKENIARWYKKRLVRILIPYLLWCVPFFVYQLVVYPTTDWWNWLYVFSLLSYWDGSGGVAWFLSVLLVLYIVAPLFYKMLMCRGNIGASISVFIVLALGLYLVGSDNVTLNLICSNMPNIISFVMGMMFCALSVEKRTINANWLVLGGLACYAIYMTSKVACNPHLFHLGSCLIALPVILILLNFTKCNCRSLQWIGVISLESYLTNGALPRVVALLPLGGANIGNYLGYGIVIVLGLFLAWMMHIISMPIINAILNEKNINNNR